MGQRASRRTFPLSQLMIDNFTPFDPGQRSSTASRLAMLSQDNEVKAELIHKLRPYVSLHILHRLGQEEDGTDFLTEDCPVVKQFQGSVAIIDMS